MKIIISLLFSIVSFVSFSQTTPVKKQVRIDPNSIVVKDSSGTVYSKEIWQKLIMTGRYTIKNAGNGNNTDYLIVRVSDEVYEKRRQNMPKPAESKYFKTGEKFISLVARDMEGKKINSKKMEGQILVVNFWFTTCSPCIQEMPELNELTEKYKNDSTVTFVAVGLEDRFKIKDFLEKHPFKYRIVSDGRNIASMYGIKSYPTHVVVSPDGKVYFHTSGYGMSTVHWVQKSIEELKSSVTKVAETTEASD